MTRPDPVGGFTRDFFSVAAAWKAATSPDILWDALAGEGLDRYRQGVIGCRPAAQKWDVTRSAGQSKNNFQQILRQPQRIQGCGVELTCCPTFETEPDSGLPINQLLTDSMENRSSSVLRDPMGLELAAILIVTAGLLVQERGIILANADCCFVSEAGERAMGFGMLISICAMPWVLIGMIISRFV